jgi:hypothetical protein
VSLCHQRRRPPPSQPISCFLPFLPKRIVSSKRTTTSKLRIRNHDISLPALSQYPIFPPFLSPLPFSSLAALYKGTFLVYLINFFCHSFILSPFSLLIRLHSKKEKKKKHKKTNKNSFKKWRIREGMKRDVIYPLYQNKCGRRQDTNLCTIFKNQKWQTGRFIR